MGYSAVTLHCLELSKYFVGPNGDRIEALRDITVAANAGTFVAVVGASGCGKTTLLRLVAGLLAPSSGRIVVNGKLVTGPGLDRAMVFQRDSLFPWRTALDNVLYGLELQGVPRNIRRSRGLELLELVGLKGFESYYPYQLSGGMRQRVNVARALAVEPGLLLMDEPFANLDAQTRELMQRELERIWRATEKTTMFVTHHLEEAVFLSDEVWIMGSRPGRLIEVLTVRLPRPREPALKRSQYFQELVDYVWERIRPDVEQGSLQPP